MTPTRPLVRRAIQLFCALSLPCLLLTVGARLLLSRQFLEFEYQRVGFPRDSFGFTSADRLEYGPLALDYLFSAESGHWLASLRLPGEKCWLPLSAGSECPLFNARELTHLADVKALLHGIFTLALADCAILGGLLLVAWRMPALRPALTAGLRLGSLTTLAILLTLGVFSTLDWTAAFDWFHETLFAAGSWRFLFSDSLIRLYPERLFVDAAIAIAAFAAAGALAMLVLLWRAGREPA